MEFALGLVGLLYIVSPLLAWGIVHWHWRKVGADPVLERTTVIPQYEPFRNLPPAVIGVVVDTRVNDFDITATLLDLAVRRYLRIDNDSNVTEHFGGKVKYYRTVDYRLVLLRPDFANDSTLFTYERELLQLIFAQSTSAATVQTSVDLRSAVTNIARHNKQLRAALYIAAVQAGLFTLPAQLWRGRYYSASRWLIAIGLVTGLFGIGLPILLYGIILRIYSRWMAQRTPLGMEAVQWSKGFKLFLHHAERYRAQRLSIEQAEHILPYVVVLHMQIPAWQFEFPHLPKTDQFFQATTKLR